MSSTKEFKKYLKEKKVKIKPQEDLRKRHMELAIQYGFQEDLQKIWNRYDSLLMHAKPEEHEQIAIMGLVEIHRLLGCSGPLVVNGKEILPPRQSYEDDYIINKDSN